ncbi:MAG TPA: hypothetical protein PLZ24_10500, partial [Flavobacteriales bacterium]|nr:hypothetical protein [Flavobacteriales bacterium]
MKRTIIISIGALLGVITLGGGTPTTVRKTLPPFLERPSPWADSVLASLSLEQRIAQLMMVAAYSNQDAKHIADIDQLVKQYGIGGLIFFQ